jgi:hypothetical protein
LSNWGGEPDAACWFSAIIDLSFLTDACVGY